MFLKQSQIAVRRIRKSNYAEELIGKRRVPAVFLCNALDKSLIFEDGSIRRQHFPFYY